MFATFHGLKIQILWQKMCEYVICLEIYFCLFKIWFKYRQKNHCLTETITYQSVCGGGESQGLKWLFFSLSFKFYTETVFSLWN